MGNHKNGPESSPSPDNQLDNVRKDYFKLREYLRANYKKLDTEISDKIAGDPASEYFPKAKEALAQVAFDDRFDANTISKEDIGKVANSVLTNELEFFYNDELEKGLKLSDLARNLKRAIEENIAQELVENNAKTSYLKLREYLRSNYKKLDARISDRIADDPANEYYPRVKEALDQIAFDENFDVNIISKEEMRKIADSVLTDSLEFFYNDEVEKGLKLSDLARIIRRTLEEK